ncbi:MAG TPA: UDP-2,3-diacylglucosamine diphosphatase [Saprospiraceae bacterium]|nr:UDP-2,3-diacylglucosamine diphosphatase [Saprospiraceae bacterium]
MKYKKVYFISDLHLGLDARFTSREREKQVVQWLEDISTDCHELYFLGDVFDAWFEYQTVIPKGHTRFLGALAAICDAGIPVSLFTGNHDMWLSAWLEDELGAVILKSPIKKSILHKLFLLGHGDGLGPGDQGYKFIKKVFANRPLQWLYRWIHPDIGIPLMKFISRQSREHQNDESQIVPNRERQIIFSEQYTLKNEVDFIIFGHRHIPIDYILSNGTTRYINLGDWLQHYTYGIFDGEEFRLEKYLK